MASATKYHQDGISNGRGQYNILPPLVSFQAQYIIKDERESTCESISCNKGEVYTSNPSRSFVTFVSCLLVTCVQLHIIG